MDKAYGGDSHDNCYDLITTEGGGYLLGGVSKSSSGDVSESGRGAEDYWIVKIDADGNKIWDKRFGGNSYDSLKRISQTSDGGYLLAGDSTSNNASGDKSDNGKGGNDYWVVRIDASGNKLWDKTYGGSGDDWFSGLTQTDNGGFLLNGSSESNQTGDKTESSGNYFSYWLVRIDSSGNKLWDKTLRSNGDMWSKNAIVTNKGSFIVLGRTWGAGESEDRISTSYGLSDYWAAEIDEGNKINEVNSGNMG